MIREWKTAFLVIGVCLLVASFAAAQSGRTSLRGTIYDPKGAVVPGAEVTLANPNTGFFRTIKTDNDGSYQFLEIPRRRTPSRLPPRGLPLSSGRISSFS